MVVLHCLRPDATLFSVRRFVSSALGPSFVRGATPFDLQASFAESNRQTPIVLILSPLAAADPLAAVRTFSTTVPADMAPTSVTALSLGRGQGKAAEEAVRAAAVSGEWVVLQNCHLAQRWLPRLAKLWEEEVMPVGDGGGVTVHRTFRLWLTSYSTPAFPPALLQTAVKLCVEAPAGMRANTLLALSTPPASLPEWFALKEASVLRLPFRRLVYGLCMFHGAALERREYGAVGWNEPEYDFSKADLDISLKQLREALVNAVAPKEPQEEEEDELPLYALQYLIAECNYGGRVSDAHDRRLLVSLLRQFFNHSVARLRGAAVSESGAYRIPEEVSLPHFTAAADSLPDPTLPEGLGLDDNASMARNERQSAQLLAATLATQRHLAPPPPLAASLDEGLLASQALTKRFQRDMLDRLPLNFDLKDIERRFPVSRTDALSMVLRLEARRYPRDLL